MTIFISPEETEIIRIGVQYLHIEGACYVGIGCLFLLYGLLPRPGPGRSVRGSHNYFPGNESGSGLSFVACSGHRASGNLVGCAYRVVPGRCCGILVFLENGEEKRSLERRQCAGDGVFCSRKKYLLIKNEKF